MGGERKGAAEARMGISRIGTEHLLWPGQLRQNALMKPIGFKIGLFGGQARERYRKTPRKKKKNQNRNRNRKQGTRGFPGRVPRARAPRFSAPCFALYPHTIISG